MATVDVRSQVSVAASMRPQAVTAATNGSGVDLQGYEGALIVIELGTFAGTTPEATLEIGESNDNSNWAAVASTDLDGTLPAKIDTTNDESVIELGYKGTKRYIRVSVKTITGTGASLPISAIVVRTNARKQPA